MSECWQQGLQSEIADGNHPTFIVAALESSMMFTLNVFSMICACQGR